MTDVTFEITDAVTQATVGQGTLTIANTAAANGGYSVTAAQGTINGQNTSGTSSTNSSDNELFADYYFSGIASDGYEEFYGVDGQGLSFLTAGPTYSLKEQGSSQMTGLLLTSSSGSSETVNLEATYSTLSPKCFASGTLIHAACGKRPIEHLQIGDLILTASGTLRPIRWIGSRTIAHPTFEQCPVRIRAGAFGAALPARDLFLSPGHPVLVGADPHSEGGHLVPIMCLVNGTTIARHPVDSVTYWHVELDAHDILLAEGLPAESYVDLGSRPWFGGADGALYDPDFVLPGMPGRCRPVAVDGPVVEAERRWLDAVFAAGLVAQCEWAGAENENSQSWT